MRATIVLATIIFSAIILIFGYYGYPIRAINDATAYIVPGIRMAMVGTLDSPILWTGDHAQTTGPFLVQMPLFPVLLHFFISPNSHFSLPNQVLIVIAVINAIVIALSAWGLYTIVTVNGRKLDWLTTIFIVAALFLVLRASWTFGGRGETLVRLFFTIAFILTLKIKKPIYLACGLGVMLGCIAASTPVTPVFFVSLVGIFFGIQYNFRQSLKYTALTIVTGLFTFILVMQLSPHSIFATLRGILNYARATTAGTFSIERNIFLFFTSWYKIIYGVIALLFSYFAARIFRRALKNQQIGSPLFVILSLIGVFFYIVFIVINGLRLYYIAPFLLLIFAAIIYFLRTNNSLFIKNSISFLFVLLVFVSLENILYFPSFVREGKKLPVARAEFQRVLRENPGLKVSLGGPRMWTLSEDYARMISGDLPTGFGRYLYALEEEGGVDLEEQFDFCKLSSNFYTQKTATLFGISLGRAVPGYGFAMYDCEI